MFQNFFSNQNRYKQAIDTLSFKVIKNKTITMKSVFSISEMWFIDVSNATNIDKTKQMATQR